MSEEDAPRNVKELLVEAKDVSELMVDLAYAAVFFSDDHLAEEVEVLEKRMDGYLRRLREVAMLAARSPEDAEAMAGVLHVAAAMEKIGDAASDIGRVIQAKLGIPAVLRADLRHADEIVGRVRVREGAPCVGRSLKELLLPSETGMWLLAVRRGDEWEFDPQAETVLSEGDVLLFQGPEEGVNLIRGVAGAPPLPPAPESEAPPLSELDRAVDILVEMKNSAEVAVGLAYSSLLFKDPALAAEVATLEARSDFFDAARDMTWLIEQGEELHPVIQMALEETEEVAAETVIEPGSRAQGRSLKQLELETETGMFVLAVQRGRRWIYRPRPRFELEAGDRVISLGPEEGVAEIEALARAPAHVVDASQ